MTRTFQTWRAVLALASLAAWLALALDAAGLMLPMLCAAGPWPARPDPKLLDLALLELALIVNPPSAMVLSATLMTAAMMLPLAVSPLQHLRDRSFAQRRTRAMLLFLSGYVAVWIAVTVALQVIALVEPWGTPPWVGSAGFVAGAALLWQVSPLKQWCLNRCHRRPHLAAFGLAANRDAIAFGLTNGIFCAGACWAVMLVSLSTARGHLAAMAFAAVFIFAERLERPAGLAWRWRFPSKAIRIATHLTIAQLRNLARYRYARA